MTSGVVAMLLLQAAKVKKDHPDAPASGASHVSMVLFAAVLVIGLVISIGMIVRSLRGRPKDSSSSGRTCM